MSVRLATVRDEPELFKLLVDLHRFNKAGWGLPYEPGLVRRRIEAATRPNPETRTNPQDQLRGIVGVIGPEGGRLIGSVGLFIEPFFWFTSAPSLVEIWFYVRPEERNQAQHHRDLFEFSRWTHDRLKAGMPNYRLPFDLFTGFVHMAADDKLGPMERLWRKLSGATKAGVLFARRR